MYALQAAAFALGISAVAAQSLPNLPTCAQQCVGNSIQSTGCQFSDYKCICTKSQLISDLSCCVSKQCDAAGQQATVDFANSICSQVGVTLPQQASCAANAGGSSSTAAAVSSRSMSSASSSVAASLSSAASSGTASLSSATAGAATTAPASTSATSSAAAPGALVHNVQTGNMAWFGMIGATVAGVFAFML